MPAAVIMLAAATGLSCGGTREKALPVRHIIFIVVDTLRADRLGCYGYGRETSPAIDRFAAESVRFAEAVAPMSTTLPSHTSLFTGLYPRAHGVIKNGQTLAQGLVTLPEILREAGYTTAGIVSAYPLAAETGFDQGFDYYLDVKKTARAGRLLERARPWIEEHAAEPFFLFLHLWDPHRPYRPPKDYRLWGDGKSDRYDGEVRYVDETLGRLLGFLRTMGLYEESLIVLAGDHGESLGEHGFFGHGLSLYDVCLRVPLVIRPPRSTGMAPAVVRDQVSLVDVTPTLLPLLGLASPQPMEGIDLFGGRTGGREVVFAQRTHYEGQDAKVLEPVPAGKHFEYGDKYVARTREWKYILRTRYDDEYYDLGLDPGEERNLLDGGTDPGKIALIREWLDNPPISFEVDLHIDESVRERLRALGYAN